MANVRISVTDDQGTLLDTVEVSRDEFLAAQGNALAALSLLEWLQIGDES